ncbi:MAG: heparinase II/III family protein, partial [Anaerolineales bacterium]
MAKLTAVQTAVKSVRYLGPAQVALYGLYKLGLKSGHFRRAEAPPNAPPGPLAPLFDLPARETLQSVLGEDGLRALRAEAEEIIAGQVRLFGGPPVDLCLTFDQPLHHWTAYEENPSLLSTFNLPHNDIKFLWEPARFGWAFTLGRAYHLTGEEKYALAFWRYTEQFLDANPPYRGPHWMNGQEAALRLMALTWAGQVFAPSAHSTPARMEKLAAAVAAHAQRIPPTLLYARAQNNNHLLTEAAALYTAGLALPAHPQAAAWRALGWKWLTWCFENQIDAYGEYVQ